MWFIGATLGLAFGAMLESGFIAVLFAIGGGLLFAHLFKKKSPDKGRDKGADSGVDPVQENGRSKSWDENEASTDWAAPPTPLSSTGVKPAFEGVAALQKRVLHLEYRLDQLESQMASGVAPGAVVTSPSAVATHKAGDGLTAQVPLRPIAAAPVVKAPAPISVPVFVPVQMPATPSPLTWLEPSAVLRGATDPSIIPSSTLPVVAVAAHAATIQSAKAITVSVPASAAPPAASLPPKPAPAVAPPPARPLPPAAPPKPPVPLRDRLPAPLSQLIFGGNMLVKIGVLILFLGLAFLLRYTAERVTVPIELRYAAVALVGAVLLGFGWFLRNRRASYGLILQGAGIGVFYLTTLGAMKVHPLLPAMLGFTFLFAVAVLSAVLAVRQNAPLLAVVAALEGFAAPVLASTGSNQAVGLFTYLLVLDAGIFLVAWFRAWRVLNLIGMTGTFVLASGWAHRYYSPDQYSTVQPFLVAFFVLFALIGLLFARRTLLNAPDDKLSLAERAADTLRRVGRVDSALVFGAPMAAFGLQYLLAKPWEFGAAFSAMGFAAFYLVLGRLVFATQPRGLRLLAEAYAIVGVIFGTLAIPLGFEGQWTGAAWAIEAAGMYWLGVRQSRPYARAFAFTLLAGSVVQLLRATSWQDGVDLPLLVGSFIGPLLVAAGALAMWALLRRAKLDAGYRWEHACGSALPWIGMAALTLLPWQTLSMPWAAVATSLLALVAHGIASRWALKPLQPVLHVMQALAFMMFLTQLHWGGPGLPLLEGSSTGALLLGASLLAMWQLHSRAPFGKIGPLALLADAWLPWAGMAALTLLPWMLLVTGWASVVTVFMALVALSLVQYYPQLQPMRRIAGVMQLLAVAGFATTLDLGAVGQPLLLGSLSGALLMGVGLLAAWALDRRASAAGHDTWGVLTSAALPWAGMAALTLLPWLALVSPWAAPATALLALATFVVAVRFALQPLRAIVHALQALAVVALIATLHSGTAEAGGAALASGWRGMVAAGLIALSVLATAAWSMRRAHIDALATGIVPKWSTTQTVGILAGVSLLHLAMLFGADLPHAALIWPFTAIVVLWVALRMAHAPLAVLAAAVHVAAALLLVLFTPRSGELAAFAHLGFWTPLALSLTALVAADWLRAQARHALAQQTAPAGQATTQWVNTWCSAPLALWASLLWGLVWWIDASLGESLRVLLALELMVNAPAAAVGIVLVTSLLGSIVAARRDWRQLGLVTLATLAAWILAALGGWVANGVPGADFYLPSSGLGWLAWPLALAWHLRLLQAQRRWAAPSVLAPLHVAGLWFFLLLAARECQWQFGRLGDAVSSWPLLGWVLIPVLVLWALRSRALLNRWPLTEHRKAYLELALLPVAGYLLVWCWVSNVLSAGEAAPLPFVPLLNPLELAQWLVLAALLLWWKALPVDSGIRLPTRIATGLALLTGWALLTGMVLRACHHYAGVPWQLDALYASTLTQAALSITWALCGVVAMVLGNRRGQRAVWVIGGVLLAVVVLKLFFVELADRGGLFRIVSFLSVGVLLLLVGYFAPVPPAAVSSKLQKPTEGNE